MDFDEIMNFHADNRIVYEKIRKHTIEKSLVPFIGAGLSAFMYPMWIPYLTGLADIYIETENIKSYIFELLKNFKCEEAASIICQEMGEYRFYAHLRDDFSSDKINNDFLVTQSMYLIPLLFKQLLLTTNFDLVLERAFLINKLPLTLSYPNDTTALFESLRGKAGSTLYKFHGDITKNAESIIFTKESYEKHYKNGTALVKDLKLLMKAKTLLFIGCSLQQDRTMQLLTNILSEGMDNYAIISCNSGNQHILARRLSEKHILAIMYPPDNNHYALKIILEHLVVDLGEPSYFAVFFSRNECLNNILKYTVGKTTRKKAPDILWRCF